MSNRTVSVAKQSSYVFTQLGAGKSVTLPVPQIFQAARFRVGTLMVRVHSADVDNASDGSISVHVRSSGHTKEDPATIFTGSKLVSIQAADKDTTGSAYHTQAFYVDGGELVVEVEGTQDSSSPSLDLEASLSISLLLDDSKLVLPTAIFGADLNTWWRGDRASPSSWASRVGGHTGNATAGEEPSIGAINGRHAPGYSSPGVDDDGYILSSAQSWFKGLHDGTGGTIGIAMQANAASTVKYLFDEIRGAATRTGMSVYYNGSDAVAVRVGNSSGTLVVDTSVDVSATITDPHFLIFRFDTAEATDWSLFVDQGKTADTSGAAVGTPATGNATLSPRLLASSKSTGTLALDGYCADIVIVDSFATDIQVEQLARYFASRYRI